MQTLALALHRRDGANETLFWLRTAGKQNVARHCTDAALLSITIGIAHPNPRHGQGCTLEVSASTAAILPRTRSVGLQGRRHRPIVLPMSHGGQSSCSTPSALTEHSASVSIFWVMYTVYVHIPDVR